ncbi:class I SAM-dependent methyltransferase [Burkholderia stagnalis]|uniref:class I SAM-dependent methyltransferase n=1 Tax=Burkholderia stagnalis TaxID=1503054 RepID=UPI000F8022BB|nr:class I SAM-dependent methyltransferase [Burkholderia stagnalis]
MSNERAEFFTRVYRENLWNGLESRSGQGSDQWFTKKLAEGLPDALRKLGVSRLLDLPCGDFNWMKSVDLTGVDYIGGDIVPDMIEVNNVNYGSPSRQFVVLDIATSMLPSADMIFVRDCFIHFSNELIFQALGNIARSDIRYLCLGTLSRRRYPPIQNIDLERTEHGVDFQYRPIQFESPPYSFPEPILEIEDGAENSDVRWISTMAVWEISSIRDLLEATKRGS